MPGQANATSLIEGSATSLGDSGAAITDDSNAPHAHHFNVGVKLLRRIMTFLLRLSAVWQVTF
jgi:hypothetical protein